MRNPGIGDIVARIQAAPARCGTTRVVLIDGPAGAGKSTLAARLAVALGGVASAGAGTFTPESAAAPTALVQTLHGDDMYEGWEGLTRLDQVLWDQVLAPLAASRVGAFHLWDWVAGRRTHRIEVPPLPYLLIEGVGVASRAAREVAALVIWVEAPWEERLRRGLARDGDSYDVVEQWRGFEADTGAIHAASGARDAAQVHIDGTAPVPD